VIRINRPEVGLTIDGESIIVHHDTLQSTVTFHLSREELIALTAELYDLDPQPLLCGDTPGTSCAPGCCRG
jgi:hypothetical protein